MESSFASLKTANALGTPHQHSAHYIEPKHQQANIPIIINLQNYSKPYQISRMVTNPKQVVPPLLVLKIFRGPGLIKSVAFMPVYTNPFGKKVCALC